MRDPALLIVEDDREMLDVLTARFARSGFAVTAAAHPREALHAAETEPFAAALIDWSLPEQDGIELMKRLLDRLPGLHTIILSGHADPAYEEYALQSGAVSYLRKPCRLAAIEARVYAALQADGLPSARS